MITLYLYDNVIQSKEKEEIKEHVLPIKVMDYGKIKNIPMFEKHLKMIAKKEKWVKLVTSKKINIILPNYYNECDKEILNAILVNIGFKGITFTKENHLISLKKNSNLINVFNKYLVITKRSKNSINSEVIPYYILGNLEKTLEFILSKKTKKSRYFFIGNNDRIPELIEQKKSPNLYYYFNYKTYIINQISP